MGKFFDALEKFNKEKVAAVQENNAFSMFSRKGDRSGCDREEDIDPNLVLFFRPHTYEAEQFRLLRTNIMFPKAGKAPRVILVTSAVPEEGKSFVASNLAVTIAQSVDNHVLLVDCDLRLPSIHSIFGFPAGLNGLGNFLNGECDLSSVFYPTKVEKLSIIPGGSENENPCELLSSSAMELVIEEVKNRYFDRYILIDSPPPIITPETIAIAKNVDAVILVVRNEKTQRGMVKEVVDAIGKDQISGVIANRFDVRLPKYMGYGGYHGLYYGRDKKEH